MKSICFFVLAALLAALFGCASTTPTREVSSAYAIYDIQAGPEVPTSRIVEEVKVALQQYTSEVRIVNGIPPSPCRRRRRASSWCRRSSANWPRWRRRRGNRCRCRPARGRS